MSMQPKLEIKLYHGDGKYDYAVFRADRSKPICSGVSRAHAEHIVMMLKKEENLRETMTPIKEWYMYDDILTDEDIENLGLTRCGKSDLGML